MEELLNQRVPRPEIHITIDEDDEDHSEEIDTDEPIDWWTLISGIYSRKASIRKAQIIARLNSFLMGTHVSHCLNSKQEAYFINREQGTTDNVFNTS
jgi:hypothetical protein